MSSTAVDRFTINQRGKYTRHGCYNNHSFVENIFDLFVKTVSISNHQIYYLRFSRTPSTTEEHDELTLVPYAGQQFELTS
jgi:hypothetical protein